MKTTIFKTFGLVLILISSVIYSCKSGYTNEELTSEVKASISAEFLKVKEPSYSVKSLSLIKKSNNEYLGAIEVTIDGDQGKKFPVTVTVDGKHFMWKIDK